MAGRVQGKVAFITGAARGQGRSHAVRLAEEGADIIALDICAPVETVEYTPASPDDLAETVELVEKLGQRIVAEQADVRDFEAVDAVLRRGVEKLGRLDTVIANAGIATYGLAAEQSESQWQTMIDINLTGAWHTAKAAIPVLTEQNSGGSILFISSLAGIKGFANAVSYSAAKFGLVGISRVMAQELATYGIRVNTLHPTNVHTTMLDNPGIYQLFRPDLEKPTFEDAKDVYSSMNMMPLPWVEAIDVSNAVLWLVSDEARYVTGVSLPVDLGASAK